MPKKKLYVINAPTIGSVNLLIRANTPEEAMELAKEHHFDDYQDTDWMLDTSEHFSKFTLVDGFDDD